MSYALSFTIENATQQEVSVPIEIDGAAAAAIVTKTVVEALPIEKAGRTLTLVLPADAFDTLEEGYLINLTVEIVPPTSADVVQPSPEA